MKNSEPTQARNFAEGNQNKPTIKITLGYLQPRVWKYVLGNEIQYNKVISNRPNNQSVFQFFHKILIHNVVESNSKTLSYFSSS